MLAPVRTIAPAEMPVTLDEAKVHCRVDGDDEDALIEALIAAAVDHLDGWSGILGQALVAQTWRQDFDRFSPIMRLPLGPTSYIDSVKYSDSDDAEQTVPPAAYQLFTDARGPHVVLASGQSWPATASRSDAVRVTYIAGADAADVPAAIKAAILLLVGHWYANREAASDGPLTAVPMAVDALIAPFRRIGV